jgi:hypothetical protein
MNVLGQDHAEFSVPKFGNVQNVHLASVFFDFLVIHKSERENMSDIKLVFRVFWQRLFRTSFGAISVCFALHAPGNFKVLVSVSFK